jgi:hypothetical protein
MTDKTAPVTPDADTDKSAEQVGDQVPAAQEEDAPATPDLDEVKQKFRAALDRKNAAQTDSQSAEGRGRDKITGAHGPAAGRRSFRRKSG